MRRACPITRVALAAAALLPACASPGGDGGPAAAAPPELRRGIAGTGAVVQHGVAVADTFPSASTGEVFNALTTAYEELGLTITARVPGGQVASQGHRLVRLDGRRASWWVDCGLDLSGPVADDARVLINVVSVVGAAGGGTILDTRVDAEAHVRGAAEGVRECASTGKLEALLAERVAGRLEGRAAPGQATRRVPAVSLAS